MQAGSLQFDAEETKKKGEKKERTARQGQATMQTNARHSASRQEHISVDIAFCRAIDEDLRDPQQEL